MQTSLVVQSLGSSDSSRLHHATKVQPSTKSKSYTLGAQWRSWCHICPGSQHQPPGTVSKNNCDDITKATDDRKGLKITVELTIQNIQAQIEVVSSASALIIKALKEPQEKERSKENKQKQQAQ